MVTVYIDGGFGHLYKLSGSSVVSVAQNELHVMDGRSRIAAKRVGAAFSGDSSPAERYNLEDHLGNSSVTVDSSGSLISREEYFPFGETSFGCYGKKRYRFCGKERDEESGLYYYEARYYAAWSCRFTHCCLFLKGVRECFAIVSVDPLAGEYPFYTPYQYAGNQPIVSVDLDGLEGNNDPYHGATGEMKTEPAISTEQGKVTQGVQSIENLRLQSTSNIDEVEASANDQLPTTANWIPVTPDLIRHLAYKNGIGGVTNDPVEFNRIVGIAFERTFINAFDFEKNTTLFPTDVRKHHSSFIPDVVVTQRELLSYGNHWDSFEDAPGLNFFEVKSGYKITLENNDYQIKEMIDYQANMVIDDQGHTAKESGWGGHLGLIAPVGVDIGWDVVEYAQNNGVNLFIVHPYMNPKKEGEFMFSPAYQLTHIGIPIQELKQLYDKVYDYWHKYATGHEYGMKLEGTPTTLPFIRTKVN